VAEPHFIRYSFLRCAILLIIGVSVVSCTSDPSLTVSLSGPASFAVCYGGSCDRVVTTGLSPDEWEAVVNSMTPAAPDPQTERRQLAEAVAVFERSVGPKTGTTGDLGGTFGAFGKSGQMDCIDEATNTSTYLRLVANAGLLRWHRVEPAATRGFFLLGWPHTTAVISETVSRKRFAVDSWFHENGQPPEIVALELWRWGWSPSD